MSYINNCPQPLQAQVFHWTFESKETRFQGRSQVVFFFFFFGCWSSKFLSSVFIAQWSWMFMTGVIYKILRKNHFSTDFGVNIFVLLLSLQALPSGVFIHYYHVQIIFLLSSKFFHSPFSFFLIPSYNSSKATEAVGSHGEEWCLSSWRHSLKINTCKFKSLQV